jgi:hypothetical protein
MFAPSWLRPLQRRGLPRGAIHRAPILRRARTCLEVMEDRSVPAAFTVGPGDVAGLIAAIQ